MTKKLLKVELNNKSMNSQTTTTLTNTIKSLIVIIALLLSGISIAQTTVTLEDQCNCEVLQGTDVSAPGVATPAGADLGDLYVNTTTGTIYFWDGDSWELTSATDKDNQQVLDFSYDTATRTLTLELEDGGAPITAVLPAESLTTLTLNGNSLEYLDEDNNTNIIPLNTGSLALGADGNSLDYTNENNVTTNIALNVGALTFNPATRELVYFDETGGQTFIALPSEVITTMSGTLATGNTIGVYENENADLVVINETITSIVDNNDGNVTLVNEAGASVTISKSDITANPDGTYTFTNNDGSDVTIDTNGLVISNLVAGNRIATLTEADGTVSDINETITDITGTSTTGNEIGLYEKEDGTTVSIQETIISIVDNNDGNVTLVNEAGASVTISKSDITANLDGTYTFTNNDGSDVTIDTNGLVISNLVAGNRIATLTEADGTISDINETVTTLSDANSDGIFDFVSEDNTTTSFDGTDDQNASEVAFSPSGNIASSNTQAAIEEVQADLDQEKIDAGNAITSNTTLINNHISADQDTDETNELAVLASGAPSTNGTNSGDTYIDTDTGQLYAWDGTTWQKVGGSAIPGDASDTNELISSFSVVGSNLRITEAGTDFDVPLSSINTDAQTIALNNTTNILTLGNGTAGYTTVDLSGYVSTDDQNLTGATIDGSNILTIAIENGDPVTVDLSGYLDNTDVQDLTGASIDVSNVLTIAIENGAAVTVDLSSYLDNTDAQTIALNNTTNILTLGNGTAADTTVDLSGYVDTDTDDQTLSLTGTDLTIADGNTIDISGIDTDTDDQTLSLTGNILAIADGNSVDLSAYVDTDTDDQTLSLIGNDLTIADGNTIDISGIDTDTDDQTLSLTGTDLTIADGNTIDI
ncbi:hypothetical protein, partial [uncultured Maribacter sp.]|uniref:beta strand repeat-containing protein n=1 Tax=uncultured Maribacter sp. TaxID=431308 RepID=UPI0030D6D547